MLRSWSIKHPDLYSPVEQFSEIINSQVISCDCHVDKTLTEMEFGTQIEKAKLGSVDIFRYQSTGIHAARRKPEHVRKDASDDILLYAPLTSRYIVRQGRREIELSPGLAAFVSLDSPFEGVFIGDQKAPVIGANIRIPVTLVREQLPGIEDYLLQVFRLDNGAGGFMVSALKAAFEAAPNLDGASANLIGDALAGAVCAMGLSNLDRNIISIGNVRPSSRDTTRQRVKDFVRANLGNPDLGPDYIAKKCRLSLRSLHLAFENSGTTLASWIREQRLQKCRAELQNPGARHRSISEIAYAWGFKDVSHFSRLYKSHFGMPPSAERPQPE